MKLVSPSIFTLALALAAPFALGASVAMAQVPPTPTPVPTPGPAPAGARPGPGSLIGAKCKDEIGKLCANVPPGRGGLARCLRGHDADLGADCKGALASAGQRGGPPAGAPPAGAPVPGEKGPHGPMGHHPDGPGWGPMKAMQKSCTADQEKFCKDVQPGHGRIATCLNEHANDLSPACKNVVTKLAEHMNAPMEMHADCAADVQKLCNDVPAGMGRVGLCLGEHSAELSPACKKHVDEMKAHWGKGGPGGPGGHGAPDGRGPGRGHGPLGAGTPPPPAGGPTQTAPAPAPAPAH